MMLKWKLVALAVPLAFLVACKDQPSAPQAAVLPNRAVAADYTNNLLGGGPWTIRGEADTAAYGWFNEDGTVLAIHTTFPLTDQPACGWPGRGSWHWQVLAHFDTTFVDPATRDIGHSIMDAGIVLLDMTSPGPCMGQAVIASGRGKMHYNDNNGGGNSAYNDAFSYRGEGTLTAPGGAKVNYNGLWHCALKPGWTSWHCNTFINYSN